ncbi:MAG: macro domain-containing protein [Flavobacteriales bacterium]|nr:macro domain-containing protein [Flavobacteriales bacterium]
MITYTTGNLLEADTEALVNTVNTVGVMGKGIALQFAERFKSNLKVYKEACKSGSLTVGQLLAVRDSDLHGERLMHQFPDEEGLEAPLQLRVHRRWIEGLGRPDRGTQHQEHCVAAAGLRQRWAAMGQGETHDRGAPRWIGCACGGVRTIG